MASIERTVYPKLKKCLSDEELHAYYSLNEKEQNLIRNNANGDEQRLTLAVLLKTRQMLGYFPSLSEISKQIREYIVSQFELTEHTLPEQVFLLDAENQKKTRFRYRKIIRKYLGCSIYTEEEAKNIETTILKACYTMSDPADLINVSVEELINNNIELPAFSTLDRIVRRLRTKVHHKLFEKTTLNLTPEQKNTLETLLNVPSEENITGFSLLKKTSDTPTLSHLRIWIDRLDYLDNIIDPNPFLEGMSHTIIRQFAAEATAYSTNDMRGIKNNNKRLSLLLCLVQQAQNNTRDELVEMFLRRMSKIRNSAKDKLNSLLEKNQTVEESLIAVLGKVLQEAKSEDSDKDFGTQVHQIFSDHGGLEALDKQYECVSACHQNNYLPLLWNIFSTYRTALFRLLALMKMGSATQDGRIITALELVTKYRETRRKYLPYTIDISFASHRWQSYIQTCCKKGKKVLDRRRLEVCVFMYLAHAIRSGDVFIIGSQNYSDYRAQLLPWEECKKYLNKYCDAMNIPKTGKALVALLKKELTQASNRVDANFPENTELTIDSDGSPHLKRQKAKPLPEGLQAFEETIRNKMPERHLLDILKNTDYWAKYTQNFGPPSGSDPKISESIKRYLFTVFGYGCNLGATQTSRHTPEIVNRFVLSRINNSHINTHKLELALKNIISEYARFELPKLWGDGRKAIADGTHIELRENNLLGDQHIRYGGYGGIAYHHISDTYIALFSNFISCGVWEAVYILDGLLQNKSSFQPDTLHADTHGQSEPVFGLSRLLGIKLMPRMRTWNNVAFYRPDKTSEYQHIDKFFTDVADMDTIETHYQDLMQVIISIHVGKVLPSMLLRKLGTHNKKNKLYRAFRELGRVERTLFLLRYISDPVFRHGIREETTKIESYNDFLDWITFGGPIIKSGNPTEQEKQLKYVNLIANAIMLHNVVDLTNVLEDMAAEKHIVTKELVGRLSPYVRQHIRRFGKYTLDMEDKPEELRPKPVMIHNYYLK